MREVEMRSHVPKKANAIGMSTALLIHQNQEETNKGRHPNVCTRMVPHQPKIQRCLRLSLCQKVMVSGVIRAMLSKRLLSNALSWSHFPLAQQ